MQCYGWNWRNISNSANKASIEDTKYCKGNNTWIVLWDLQLVSRNVVSCLYNFCNEPAARSRDFHSALSPEEFTAILCRIQASKRYQQSIWQFQIERFDGQWCAQFLPSSPRSSCVKSHELLPGQVTAHWHDVHRGLWAECDPFCCKSGYYSNLWYARLTS